MSEATLAPLGVLLDPQDRAWTWERSENHYGEYAREILAHAGLSFQPLERSDLMGPLPKIVLLLYPVRLRPSEVAALESHVRSGGAVVACGGVEGGDALFGIRSSRRYLAEATLHWPEGGLELPGGTLPVWGAQLARAAASNGESLGEVQSGADETGIAARWQPLGGGLTLYLAVDVARSVVTMQQGVPVMGDARGAPDGTAPIDDRLLKCDDGAVIDWAFRQETAEGPAFVTPYGDRLRELLLAALAACAEHLAVPLPMAWYWPDALPAVATLSFDTDSNEGPDGWAFLEVLEHLEVEGTWCVMYPGGYPRELYEAIAERGHEIALHFDGLTSDLKDVPHCGWSENDFQHQLEWLRQETSVEQVYSQKNHVTRWEGWLELFRWVERAGIEVEQSKGPSKIGNLGFTFGTCHPWRPLEDLRHDNRLMEVLELPFLTHDMHHSERRVALRRQLLDAVKAHAGVAHFIFHPQRIHERGMPEAIADLVRYGREQGVPWWTSERIGTWEACRREARVRTSVRQGDAALDIVIDGAPPGFTLLLFGLPDGDYRAEPPVRLERGAYLGRSALRLVTGAGKHELRLTRETGR